MNTIDLINRHRSIRKFKDLPIEKEKMDRILECGMRAPNTGNMQIYSIIVTEQRDNIEALSKLHFGQGATAAAFLTICVDVNRYHHWCRLRGCDEPYDNFLWLMSGTVDATLAAQNICIAAESEGLGLCYLGTVMYNTQAIAELLELPKGVVPVVTLCMGYPAEEPALSERLPLEGVVFRPALGGDGVRHFADQGAVEGGGHADGLGKHGGHSRPGHPVQRLVPVVVGADAEPGDGGGVVGELEHLLL